MSGRKQLEEVLGKKDADWFGDLYGFEPEGNFLDEASREKTGANIPHLDRPLSEIAKEREKGSRVCCRLQSQEKLFEARKKRIPHPQKDDKVNDRLEWIDDLCIARTARALGDEELPKYRPRGRRFLPNSSEDRGRAFIEKMEIG